MYNVCMNRKDRELFSEMQSAISGETECSPELLSRILKAYEKKEARHDKIISQSDKQQMGLIHETERQEKMLAQQAKMAAMGEMIDAIAHQWKQPLNAISMLSEIIEMDFESGDIDEEYMKNHKEQVFSQIDHLLSTLSEFRSFFRPNKDSSMFNVKNAIDSVLILVKDELIKYTIEVEVNELNVIKIDGIENEFKHIILNIINNAKDAFNEKTITNPKIIIILKEKNNEKSIEIKDNAGGIPEYIIKDIFKPNVTTKEEGKGTGIGLYMSDQIAQKMGARLSVKNVKDGANFSIFL